MKGIRAILLASIALLPASPSSAQIVREEGVKPIGGVLGGGYPGEASWTIRSTGDEIVFASLDGEIYRLGMHQPEGEDPHTTAGETGGCGEEGGPVRFCLQVIARNGAVMCQAAKPAPPPGWQRDPRLACVLPASAGESTYAIRVSLTGPDGTCTQPSQSPVSAELHPFVLNVSVRRIPLSGVSIQQAVAISTNRFDSAACGVAAPASDWVCLNGGWLPPDSPLLWSLPPDTTGGIPPPACPGMAPGPGWICQDGNWLPPGHPAIRGGGD